MLKQFKLIASAGAIAVVFGAGAASADVVVDASGNPVKTDGAATKTNLVGSDTLNRVMDCLVNGCSGVPALGLAQINNYQGQGSSQGERQMAGSPNAGTDEPACLVSGATDGNGYPETNPGCQEIAPMTREMNTSVCEDDITTNGGLDLRPNVPAGQTSVNLHAESLAICADGILIVTDNRSNSQTADNAASCAAPTALPTTPATREWENAGWADNTSTNAVPFAPSPSYAGAAKLRRSGTIACTPGNGCPASGQYAFSDWKDVLRLIYTGCTNDGFGVKKSDGTTPDLTCGNVHRYLRCTNNVRQAVVNNWFNVVEDGAHGGIDTAVKCDGTGGTRNNTVAACSSGVDGGLRHAYRRDDASGTTGFFLSTLGLNGGVGHRVKFFSGVQNKPVDIPALASAAARPDPSGGSLDSGGNMFCDGGDVEGYVLNAIQCTANAANACPDYTVAPDLTNPASPFPKTVTCPSYGECPPAPQVGPAKTACTPGAANACRDFLRDRNNITTSLACPASGFCPGVPEMGDPLTKPCKGEDNLCAWNGRMGIVQALITPAQVGNVAAFPVVQAKRSSLGTPTGGAYFFSTFAVCPDGDPPPCRQAFFPSGSTNNFNVLNEALSRPSTNVDGRAYNPIMAFDDGTVQCLTGSPATHDCRLPAIAHWRANAAVLKTNLPQNGGAINTDPSSAAVPRARCQQADATDLIGCVVASTQCTVGFAGREVGEAAVALQAGQEPFRLNNSVATDPNILNALADTGLGAAARSANYVFSRFLYLSALGGFGNISSDCAARGGSPAYCADELKIANAFFGANYDAVGGPVCASAGFITLPSTQNDVNGVAQSMRECRGAAGPGASNGVCGATGPARQDGSLAPADNCQPL
jgi:hypothetical protein